MTTESSVHVACYMPTSNDMKFNEVALEKLFKDNFSSLCIYCQYKFGFELDTAKEAVHTGFIRLWENRESISSESSVKAYLSKIVTNICLDMLKHNKMRDVYAKQVIRAASIDSSLENCNPSELKQLTIDIEHALDALPKQMRKIFELSRYQGLKYAEIASVLNLSIKTVETQMSRALVKLRQKLSHYLTVFLIFVFSTV
jgi:RNA polymerase sigma-70 factor, ECF subfamily